MNPLQSLFSAMNNNESFNLNNFNDLSDSIGNRSPQDILNNLVNNDSNNNMRENNHSHSKKRRRHRKNTSEVNQSNIEMLKSLRNIVEPSKVEFLDKLIYMYEKGEIED